MFKKILLTIIMFFAITSLSVSATEYNKFAESANFNYYIEEAAVNIKIENKNTGETYSSCVSNVEGLNNIWANMATSGISIEYVDAKGKVVKNSSNNENVTKKFTYSDNAVKIDLTFPVPGISFTVNIAVDAKTEAMTVSIPGDSIKETNEEKHLVNIYVFPFLGATSDRTLDGYMFIPDGSGAVITYDEVDKKYNSAYYEKIYGDDIGYQTAYDEEFPTAQTTRISYPVYGIVNNEGQMGFWAHVNSGAENTYISATPAGIYTNYFWNTQVFNYREQYFKKVNREGDGTMEYPVEMKVYDASVTYNFQTSATYSSFAKGYSDYLVANGILTATKEEVQPILTTILAIEDNITSFLARDIELTTLDQIQLIVSELEQNGIKPTVIVEGWTKGGYLNQEYNASMDKQFASINDVEEFVANNPEVEFYLSKNMTVSNSSEMLDASNDEAQIAFDNLVNGKYLVDFEVAIEEMKSLESDTVMYAYNDIYRFLYSANGKTTTDMIAMLNEMEMEKTAITKPNEYGFKNTSDYIGMETSSNGYDGSTYDVPFLPMVLSGYMTMFSIPVNFQPSDDDMYLKFIEYNTYPNFYLTYENPYVLINSNLEGVFSSEYAIFKDEIIEVFGFYTPFYEATNGTQYVSHELVSNGAICEYSNGVTIVINYAEQEQVIGGVKVAANSYEVIK